MADYKEKIKKLLSLSKSPNEHEAQSALAKAQQLMAEHKISMAEVEDKEQRKANEHSAGITYSTRRDPWVLRLSKVISKNYCCESFSRREKGKQTYKLYFCGLNEDVEICMIAFKYATDCIQSEIKKRKQKGKLFNYTNELITSMCNGYAYGFIKGLDEAFEEQKRAAAQSEANWGLVLSTPPEVKQRMSELGVRTTTFQYRPANLIASLDVTAPAIPLPSPSHGVLLASNIVSTCVRLFVLLSIVLFIIIYISFCLIKFLFCFIYFTHRPLF